LKVLLNFFPKIRIFSECFSARGPLPTIQQIAFRVREWVGKLSE